MSKVAIQGNASGTGTLTVAAPNTNTDYTLTLPAETGNVVVTDGTTLYVDNANDRVGIGTSSPAAKLHISGSSAVATQILDGNGGSNGGTLYFYADISGGGNKFRSSIGGINISNGGSGLVFGTTTNGNTEPTERMRIDSSGNLQFNSGYGSVATAYGCRAWVNFNGTGTVAIRASGNVSSITDNGTGDYTVNFTTAMPDANYSAVANNDWYGLNYLTVYATGSVRIITLENNWTLRDVSIATIAIFR